MREVLGDLPKEWLTLPFVDGYPVHEPLQPGTEHSTFEGLCDIVTDSLEENVSEILEPRRPKAATSSKNGLEKFCLVVPYDRNWEKVVAENTTPIKEEDAVLFSDLLRKFFTYDHRKRLTATQVLQHPWFTEAARQQSRNARPPLGVQKLSLRANDFKNPLQAVPVQEQVLVPVQRIKELQLDEKREETRLER